MTSKRKRTTSNDYDNEAGSSLKKCSYCFKEREFFISGRSYCATCAADSSHCNVCCRPLPHRLVENGVCNTCRRKLDNKNIQTGLGGRAFVEDITPSWNDDLDPLNSLMRAKDDVRERLVLRLIKFHGVKWYIVLVVTMMKHNREGEEVVMETAFQGETETLLLESNIDDQFNKQVDVIMRRIKEFVRNGSGWSVLHIDKITLHVASYTPTSASSYIATPKYLIGKRAIVNIQNNDDKCFVWAVLSALHPQAKNTERVTKYMEFESDLNLAGIEFPLNINNVKKFENLNPDISINLFACDDKVGVYPVYISSYKGRKHVNLLLLTQGEKSHYVWIKDMSRLLSKPGYNHAKYYCNYCLHGFRKQLTLDRHVEDCSKLGLQKVMLPNEEEKWVHFKSFRKMLKVPFVIYADFESYTCKIQGPHNRTQATHAYELHEPSGFAYYIVCADLSLQYQPVVYRGQNVVQKFLECLTRESDKICDIMRKNTPMRISTEEEAAFHAAERCYLSDELLGIDRVRDHDHLTGNYRGPAHSECNLQLRYANTNRLKNKFFIPVIFHNLRGYDAHLILKGYKKSIFNKGNITCIPNNMERYLSFTIDNLRFIDSFQFMSASLDKLASNLRQEDFTHTRLHTPRDKLQLMIRKGVFCYDYWDGPDKANENQLPSRESFYSRLKEENITEDDYAHAQKVWAEFELQSLGEYHDLYLKTDVLILADVFEKFRNVCMKHYSLDACHYFSSPGLAWDAMLKMTKVHLELMTDREMHDIIDKGIRGGMCCISRKYAKANNKYMSDYDHTKPSSYILYLDMNNL